MKTKASLMKLEWHRNGAICFAKGTGIKYEINPHRVCNRLKGGDYTEWQLEANGDWFGTFPRLKDAKERAQLMESYAIFFRASDMNSRSGGYMKKEAPTNIRLTDYGYGDEKLRLSCEYNGKKYHIWIRAETDEILKLNDNNLYKNSMSEVWSDEPSYFKARLLKINRGVGLYIVPIMLSQAFALYCDILTKRREGLKAEKAASEKALRVRRAEDAAQELLAACKLVSDKISGPALRQTEVAGQLGVFLSRDEIMTIRAAIAKATAPEGA